MIPGENTMVLGGFRSAVAGNPAAPPYTNGPYEFSEQCVFDKPNVRSYRRYHLEENFAKKPGVNGDMTIDPDADDSTALEAFVIANRDFEVLGTGGTTDDVTFGTTVGGLLLTTDSSSSQEVIIAPHLNTGQTAWTNILWGTENQVIWEAVVRTGASVAAIVIWAGLKLTNTATVATDADQVFF